MSGLLYPSNLPGLMLEVIRSYKWRTAQQEALSGKQSTLQLRAYPLVHFELNYELLRDNVTPSDLRALVGLHNQVAGRWDTFLFTDPDFNTIPSSSPQNFGVSTGSTATTYQLVASFENSGGPGGLEMIQNLNGTPVLYDVTAAAIISAATYSISATGVVTFSTSPTSGHVLAWYGSFYYRCRFDDDEIDWTKFMNQWWEAKKVAFTSVTL
jgi:hypothetical protein